MHLHCFVGSEAKQNTSACRLTVWFAFKVWKAAGDLEWFQHCPNDKITHGGVHDLGTYVLWQKLTGMIKPTSPFHTSVIVMEPRCSFTGLQQDAMQEVHKKSRILVPQAQISWLCRQPNLAWWKTNQFRWFIVHSYFAGCASLSAFFARIGDCTCARLQFLKWSTWQSNCTWSIICPH